jgi:hypothetical protein
VKTSGTDIEKWANQQKMAALESDNYTEGMWGGGGGGKKNNVKNGVKQNRLQAVYAQMVF